MLTTRIETKTLYKIIFLAALALLVSVGIFVVVLGKSAHAANDQEDILNDKLRRLQDQITNYQRSITETQKQGASLQNEISIYDNQIASLELQVEANRTQTDDTNLQITELQTQIDRRKVEIEENKKILGQLVVQLAQLDDKSFLNIGLGTDNFSAFLDQIQYNRSITQQVYTLVSKIKEIQNKLETQQEDLKKSLEKLKELSAQLQIAQESLDSQRSDKENLLAQTKGTEKNYQKLLSSSNAQEDKIQAELYNLDAGARTRAGNPSISAKKGVLAWPMDGVLTQGYGNTGFTSLGYNFHNGLDLAAPAGKPIYAPADGTVANCNSSNYAYGNWCSIYHTVDTNGGARDIVTLYGHMRSYVVSPGQVVKEGDLIGYEGNTGNTTRLIYGPDRGYHVHFTVFDRKGYTVTKGAYGDYMVPSGVTYNPISFLGN
jgi:murein DD-endopeptidase MepM/ murein hydrolase activator NlpD